MTTSFSSSGFVITISLFFLRFRKTPQQKKVMQQLGVYLKFLIIKLPNVSHKYALSICKRFLRSPINKRNKELQHHSKELSLSDSLSTQLSTIDFYILTKYITSYNKKWLRQSLFTQQKQLCSLTRDCNLAIFKANETITNLTQYELSQEKPDLLKAGLYFSIQPHKIRKSKIFTTFEKINCSFLNNLKSEETKSQMKAHLSYLANSCFYNYKPSPRVLRQHRVLRNLRENKDIVITKPDKGNGVVIFGGFAITLLKKLFQILLNSKSSTKTQL